MGPSKFKIGPPLPLGLFHYANAQLELFEAIPFFVTSTIVKRTFFQYIFHFQNIHIEKTSRFSTQNVPKNRAIIFHLTFKNPGIWSKTVFGDTLCALLRHHLKGYWSFEFSRSEKGTKQGAPKVTLHFQRKKNQMCKDNFGLPCVYFITREHSRGKLLWTQLLFFIRAKNTLGTLYRGKSLLFYSCTKRARFTVCFKDERDRDRVSILFFSNYHSLSFDKRI